jgi:hypothetical protein
MTLEEKKARLAELQANAAPTASAAPPVNAAPMDLAGKKARLAELQAKAARGPAKEEESGFEDFAEGLAVSGMESYYGIKELFGQMDAADRVTLAEWKEDASESGWGTAGQVTGEIAQFMIPGGAVLKGAKAAKLLKGASKVKNAAKLMGLEGATAAAVGGLRLPDEGETRGENMLSEGTLGAVGAGVAPLLGRALSKTMRGADKTDDAIKMLDEGIDLTPGMIAKSQGIQGLETAMEVTPFAAQGTKKLKQIAGNQWNLKTLKDAMPEGVVIDEIGDAGLDQMRAGITKAYDDAWKGAGQLKRKDVVKMMDVMRKSNLRLGKADERVMQSMWDDVEKLIADKSRKGFQSADDMLRRRIKAAGSDKYDLSEALKKARVTLRAQLDPDAIEALRKVDSKYPDYLTAKDAVNRADLTGGVFTPDQYTKPVSKIGKGSAKKDLKSAASAARNTVGKKEGGQPLDFFRRIAGALPSPPGMKTAGRTLMGQTAPQKFVMRGVNNPTVQALRDVTSTGGATAALFNDD